MSRLKSRIRNRYYRARVQWRNHLPRAKPIFSVVIPIYDRTGVVAEAIHSVLTQSFVNFELLLVCDGSPPQTRAVVEQYRDHRQVRIHHFAQSSGNACRARNHGVMMAAGEFVAFLDSDDIAAESRLERSYYYLLREGVDLVGGAIEYLVEDESNRQFENGQIGFTSEKVTYQHLLEQNMLSICTVAVRRSWLLRYGQFRKKMRYREDHELWLRLARNGCSIHNVPEVFAKYRIHQGNAELGYLKDDDHWFKQALTLHKMPYRPEIEASGVEEELSL